MKGARATDEWKEWLGGASNRYNAAVQMQAALAGFGESGRNDNAVIGDDMVQVEEDAVGAREGNDDAHSGASCDGEVSCSEGSEGSWGSGSGSWGSGSD